jgi:manganese transport protein
MTIVPNSQVLTPPTGLLNQLRYVGPSLIISATLVGSGELLATTTFGAKVGFAGMWLIVGACVVKVALQEALGRYVVSSGDTTLDAFSQLPGPKNWAVWFWLVVVLSTAVQLGAVSRVVGEAVALVANGLTNGALPGAIASSKIVDAGDAVSWSGGKEFIWAPVACLICLILLYNGRYSMVERVSSLLVSAFSISTIVCAVAVQWTRHAASMAELSSGFHFELPEQGVGMALGIVAIVGLSASELVYYGYWCLEKGYARWTGPNDGSVAWQQRARGWIRVMHVDCLLGFLIYTSTTVAFYFLGATILHRRGIDPGEGAGVLTKLSRMYTDTLGQWAWYLFIFSAFSVLFSTLFVSIASYARLVPDACFILAGNNEVDERQRKRWVQRCIIWFAILFAVMAQVRTNPVVLVVVGVIGMALLLPVIAFAAIWLRYRRLDHKLVPSGWLDAWLWLSATLTIVVTFFSLTKGLAGLLGGDT